MSSPTQGAWACAHNVDGRDWCPDCFPEPVVAPRRAWSAGTDVRRDDWDRLLPPNLHVAWDWRRGMCMVTDDTSALCCSRPKGHTGRHAMYGTDYVLAVWE